MTVTGKLGKPDRHDTTCWAHNDFRIDLLQCCCVDALVCCLQAAHLMIRAQLQAKLPQSMTRQFHHRCTPQQTPTLLHLHQANPPATIPVIHPHTPQQQPQLQGTKPSSKGKPHPQLGPQLRPLGSHSRRRMVICNLLTPLKMTLARAPGLMEGSPKAAMVDRGKMIRAVANSPQP